MFRYSLWPRARSLKPKAPPTVVRSGSRSLASQSPSSSSPKNPARDGPARPSPLQYMTRAEQLGSLQKAGIGLPSSLTRLPKVLPNFSIQISPRHCLRFIDMPWFNNVGHPKGLLISAWNLDHNKTKPLWKATLISGGQSIVRGKAKARVNVAFLQALRNMGYDGEGRKVDPTMPRGGGNRDAWRRKIAELHGTVQLRGSNALEVWNRPIQDMRKAFEGAIRTMEETMGMTAAGKKANVDGHGSPSERPRSRATRRTY